MKQLFDIIKKSIKTGAYFYALAVRKKRSYPLIIILSILISAAAPFINIIGPKMIIEELMGSQGKIRLLILAASVISSNFIAAVLLKILSEIRTMQEDELSREFELKMSDKAMHIKYELTENEKALSARQKAETGMSWYSGGLKGLSDCIVGIGTSIFVVIGVIMMVMRVSPLLLLLSFIAVLVNSFCSAKIYQAAQEVFEKTPAINKFYTYIYTKITGREYAKELRLYDAGELVEEKSVENADALNRMDNECARKQFAWGIPGSIMSALSYGISYCCLGLMALKGSISIAEFVMCISAIETFTNNGLLSAINNIQQLIMKSNFMKAFIEYMELEDGAYTGDQGPDMDMFEGIVFENVSFKYPGTDEYILKDINLTIHKGERISIVGLNGAGKSTLVKLICRLYDVTEGSISLCGRDIREYSFEEYIKQLSVVFQDFKLFGYSIDENIRMGDPGTGGKSIEKAIDISGLRECVNGLKDNGDTLVGKDYDEHGVELSGGQAQKLAIARAVYRDAPLVILDEPTAALDPVAEYEIYKSFNELIGDKTAVYISHRLSSCRFCDRIIVIDGKTVSEAGSHDELMKKQGKYAEMFNAQAQWYA